MMVKVLAVKEERNISVKSKRSIVICKFCIDSKITHRAFCKRKNVFRLGDKLKRLIFGNYNV